MAATIARATGGDSTREKTVTRLGHQYSQGVAATWHSRAVAHMSRDGSGYIEVSRNGKTFHRFDFGPESERN